MVAIARTSGLYPNNAPPHYIVGNSYLPAGYNNYDGQGALTTTANRCYYFPLAVWELHTFAGAQVFNSGVGDNGEKIRLMVFNDDLTSGGPGTLAKDFGEITLTAASALRTLTSSWTAFPGMYWGAVWHETAADMYPMSVALYQSAAGWAPYQPSGALIGQITPSATDAMGVNALYVDTAYGAAPATAVAPTASRVAQFNGTGSTRLPVFWLKA